MVAYAFTYPSTHISTTGGHSTSRSVGCIRRVLACMCSPHCHCSEGVRILQKRGDTIIRHLVNPSGIRAGRSGCWDKEGLEILLYLKTELKAATRGGTQEVQDLGSDSQRRSGTYGEALGE